MSCVACKIYQRNAAQAGFKRIPVGENLGGSEKSRLFSGNRKASLLAAAAADFRRRLLLGEKDGLDVGQNAALGDRHARQQLVELLVVADGQLEVARDDARLLVISRRVASQLEHLGRQVLHHGRQVDGCAGADALGVVAFAQQAVDSSDRELKAGARRARLRLSLHLAAFASSGHVVRGEIRVRTKTNNRRTLANAAVPKTSTLYTPRTE